uniref:NBR1 autophagy cargo receptor b n=1 Tax=Sphaeramia orbicularis TaxID=375764 RepID=A0A672YN37_9TELE
GDRSFRKAEKQRLKAEKRLLKAEVKEIRKQLRMERRGLQWSSSHQDGSSSPVLLQPRRPCPLVVPAMTAAFLDENLPDGTRLRPGTKFIKYWKMRNTGTISWSPDTKVNCIIGNILSSGIPFVCVQVGIVSVALCAPTVEGSYTSHWRLAHAGEQFGPRVWCSIVVDPLAPAPMMADGILVSPCITPQNPVTKDGKASAASREQPLMSVDQEEYYIPSVDLLTAQDLLSFELLDINIVQELESVPNNTPAGKIYTNVLGVWNSKLVFEMVSDAWSAGEGGGVPAQEEGENDISGTQFVCETVIRSMTLEEAPDHAPVKGSHPGTGKDECSHMESIRMESRDKEAEEDKDKGEEKREGMRSRSSSTSSEDYIIILPDCFDTSRPLGESMYRSDRYRQTNHKENRIGSKKNPDWDITNIHTTRDPREEEQIGFKFHMQDVIMLDIISLLSLLRHPGITSGLVKGALSVAASAYKALFTGQAGQDQTLDTMMAVLVEMGFGDQSLNQRLLKKHNYNLLDVVNELVQITNNDWYSTRY